MITEAIEEKTCNKRNLHMFYILQFTENLPYAMNFVGMCTHRVEY
jgi:hypothetical protein